jgi:plasmid stability protein
MATLTIRKVDPEVQKRLRVRAAENGRSMEAELRQILKDAVGGATAAERQEEESGLSLAEAIRRRFARYGGVELEIPPREPAGPPRVKFDE